MPTRTYCVRFPTITRNSGRVHDPAMQVAPGIFATTHKAAQQFFLSQAVQMQLLANSAGVKQRSKSRLKRSEKGLETTHKRHQQDTTNPTGVPHENIKVQVLDDAILNAPEVVSETSHIDVRDAKITELEEHNARLQTEVKTLAEERDHAQNLYDAADASRKETRDAKITELEEHNARLKTEAKTIAEERDRVRSMYEASEAALIEINLGCTKIYDEQVGQSRIKEEEFQCEKVKLQVKLSESVDSLKSERTHHDATRQDLEKSLAASLSSQLALVKSEAAFQKLKVEHDSMESERTALRQERDSLGDELQGLRCQNEDLREERDLAAQAQADAIYASSEKDEQLKSAKLELEPARKMLSDQDEDLADAAIESDDTLIGSPSLNGESNETKVDAEHPQLSDLESDNGVNAYTLCSSWHYGSITDLLGDNTWTNEQLAALDPMAVTFRQTSAFTPSYNTAVSQPQAELQPQAGSQCVPSSRLDSSMSASDGTNIEDVPQSPTGSHDGENNNDDRYGSLIQGNDELDGHC